MLLRNSLRCLICPRMMIMMSRKKGKIKIIKSKSQIFSILMMRMIPLYLRLKRRMHLLQQLHNKIKRNLLWWTQMSLILNQCKKSQRHLLWKPLFHQKKEFSIVTMMMMITHKKSHKLKYSQQQQSHKYSLQKNKDFLIVMMTMMIYLQQKLLLSQLKQLLQQK